MKILTFSNILKHQLQNDEQVQFWIKKQWPMFW